MDNDLLMYCRIISGFKTRKEFAEALGVHPSSVTTRWETGTVPINERWKSKVFQLLASKGIGQEEIDLLSELKRGYGTNEKSER
ncbi:helix-turn-helix domain-containing protein [Aquibacillus albus]|uniref:XRE family transcriptional regulator n=1 Tax=Aquibacillus albus TaxID=1168171 RepID=A0ABS2N469_9BACI|nr:helix-turn-helix transcriptional regulator [Aquibacillus albus]MBM7572922.1 hypothetical protein [Aquibacillus albus]